MIPAPEVEIETVVLHHRVIVIAIVIITAVEITTDVLHRRTTPADADTRGHDPGRIHAPHVVIKPSQLYCT